MNTVDYLKTLVAEINDFPRPGIQFKDIMPVLNNSRAFRLLTEELVHKVSDLQFDRIVGIESRGFILGAAMALQSDRAFVPIRKPGKLPGRVRSIRYELEYGEDQLEIQEGSLRANDRVLIVDDVLATGGTLRASVDLVRSLQAQVAGSLVFLEISALRGRALLGALEIRSLISYS
jgi:adenine phosphoribosyltransferase